MRRLVVELALSEEIGCRVNFLEVELLISEITSCNLRVSRLLEEG